MAQNVVILFSPPTHCHIVILHLLLKITYLATPLAQFN